MHWIEFDYLTNPLVFCGLTVTQPMSDDDGGGGVVLFSVINDDRSMAINNKKKRINDEKAKANHGIPL